MISASYVRITKNDLTFIITIPIWDIEGKKAMKELYNNELEKQNIDYGEFEIINSVKNSKYFNLDKSKFNFINFKCLTEELIFIIFYSYRF